MAGKAQEQGSELRAQVFPDGELLVRILQGGQRLSDLCLPAVGGTIQDLQHLALAPLAESIRHWMEGFSNRFGARAAQEAVETLNKLPALRPGLLGRLASQSLETRHQRILPELGGLVPGIESGADLVPEVLAGSQLPGGVVHPQHLRNLLSERPPLRAPLG